MSLQRNSSCFPVSFPSDWVGLRTHCTSRDVPSSAKFELSYQRFHQCLSCQFFWKGNQQDQRETNNRAAWAKIPLLARLVNNRTINCKTWHVFKLSTSGPFSGVLYDVSCLKFMYAYRMIGQDPRKQHINVPKKTSNQSSPSVVHQTLFGLAALAFPWPLGPMLCIDHPIVSRSASDGISSTCGSHWTSWVQSGTGRCLAIVRLERDI